MNRKKKVKIVPSEDDRKKKQKLLNGSVAETKVGKSKLKFANKSAKNIKNVEPKRRTKKNTVSVKSDSTIPTETKNRRGRKPKQAQINGFKKDTRVQRKPVKVNEETAIKRPKGRPRLKRSIKKSESKPVKQLVNNNSKNTESLKSTTKRNNPNSEKVKRTGTKSRLQAKQNGVAITNSNDMGSLPSTSKMSPGVTKRVNIQNGDVNGKKKSVASSNRKRLISQSRSILSKKRGHRVASLNASAKVKVLCESDRDSSNINKPSLSKRDGADSSKHIKPNSRTEESKDARPKPLQRKSSQNRPNLPKGKSASRKRSSNEKSRSIANKKTRRKAKARKRNLVDKDVEIIDTRRCKRMASLNATAMMAATYLPESRIVKPTPLEPLAQRPLYIDPISTISETIEQVVSDHWSSTSSTVERHIEISPASSSNLTREQKTTVKTTVKHVKLRGSSTVVETISTEYQQNILPKLSNGKAKSKAKTSPTKPCNDTQVQCIAPQVAPTQPLSAFTPCSSTSSYLGPNSIALLSTQPKSFTSSVGVQNYQTQSVVASNLSSGVPVKKRSNRSKTKEKDLSKLPNGESTTKSSSIIRKYEVKTIATRTMESTVSESSVQNSLISNSVIVANHGTSPLVNNAASLSRVNQPLVSCSLYPHQVPLHLLPPSATLSSQSGPASAESTFATDPSTALNYINIAPFSTPILHYQPIGSTFPPLNASSFSSPISVPFLLSNAAQLSSNSYNMMSQRANHLAMTSLFGLPYLNSQASTGLYQPPPPVINILPSNAGPSSGCALIHRPVAYHAQSGQVSAATRSTMPNLVNNSVFASSPFYSNLTPTPSSNLFQCSTIRSPSVASIRPLSLPVASYAQPTIYVPSSSISSSSEAVPTIMPTSTCAPPATPSNAPTCQSMDTTLLKQGSSTNSESIKSNLNNEIFVLSAEPRKNNAANELAESEAKSHIQQLTNMTNNIIPNHNEHHNSGNATDLHSNDLEKSAKLSNRAKQISITKNGTIGKNSKKAIIDRKESKLGSNTLVKKKVLLNGVLNQNLHSVANSLRKRSRLSKNTEKNGSTNVLSLKSINNGTISSPLEQSNAVNKVVCQSQPESATASALAVDGNESNSASSRLFAVSGNGLKKNRRAIIHGWSWEGEPTERNIFINNDDQPFLRMCYPAIKHHEGEIIRVRDCVLLKSGPRKTDLPFVAKITALWESLEKEMMMSLLWYYRPEHTDIQESYITGEIYASKHRDANSVACIDDKCYVLTYNEYCRYKRHKRRLQQHYPPKCDKTALLVPQSLSQEAYSPRHRVPPLNVFPELVFCCRKVFDFRQKRILKNPKFVNES